MKRLRTSDLVPGMITAEDVYNFNNQLILPKGLILNDKSITKLAFYSIMQVRVEEPAAELAVESTEESSASATDALTSHELTYSERMQKSVDFIIFRQEFNDNVIRFRSAINDMIEKGSPLDIDRLLDQTLSILHMVETVPNVFSMLHSMRDSDDATYVHCVNVAVICNIFARWLRLDSEEIRLATMSGLLHDIGKTQIPEAIVKKPGKLTDQERNIMNMHPQEGHRILQNSNIPPAVMNAVLMHHERCDGSGYPFGINTNKIGTFARIVAIADVYDAMTSARVYRGSLCPFKAIALFESEGLQKYDTRFIMTFLENVVNTYLLNTVRLNNGVTGKVVYIHRDKLSAPTIQTDHGFLDLSIHPDIIIEALI